MSGASELDQLKANWRSDPTWDIEDTEGFEEYRDELKAYREGIEAQRAERRAKEHEADIQALMKPALAFLPEKDERGGLTRGDAARDGHAANRLLRAVAAMLLPIVERLNRLDEQNISELRKLEDHVDRQIARLDGRGD